MGAGMSASGTIMESRSALVVVGETIIADDLARQLCAAGCEVSDIVGSGREAVDAVSRKSPSFVVMDIALREKSDGVETALRLWKQKDLPVLSVAVRPGRTALDQISILPDGLLLAMPFTDRELGLAVDLLFARHELWHAKHSLDGLCSTMEDVVMVFDGEGRYVSVARTNPTLLDRPADKLEGYLLSEVFPKEQAEFFLEKIRESLARQCRIPFTYALEINGEPRWFDAAVSPLGDDYVICIARDTTRTRAIERTLSETREMYTGIFEHTTMGIAQRSFDGRFTSANPALCRMYGFSETDELLAELSKKKGHRYKDPRQRARVTRMIRDQKGPFEVESQVVKNDGTLFWISESISTVRNAQGKTMYCVETIQDITSRKQAERELRLLANTIACARDCFMLTDLDARILFVNDAFTAAFGFSAEEVVGKRPDFLGGVKMLSNTLRDAFLPSSGSWNGEIECRRADGTEFPAELWTSMVRHDHGDPVAYVTVTRDISERRRDEDAIQRSETRLRRITDTMLDMIVQIDVNGVCEYASPSVSKILGYPSEGVVGRNLLAYVNPNDRRRVVEMLRGLFHACSPGVVEFRLRSATGQWVWVESSVNPLSEGGASPTGFVIGSIDVTHRKKTEENLRLNEARLETLVALTQMTGASSDKIIDFSLEEGVRLTRSALGFLAFLNDEGTSITQVVWSSLVKKECPLLYEDPCATMPLLKVLMETASRCRPLIVNDQSQPAIDRLDAHKVHLLLKRYMIVPVLDSTRVIALVGVANKDEDYDVSDARQLTLLIEGMWLLLQRQRSREKLQQSLEEKEVLLKEVHHRVKNNLQIISSLLNLQVGQMPDGPTAEVLKESQNRIRSMALIHERLYRSSDLSRVDFGHYLRNLASFLGRMYESSGRSIRLKVDVQNILLGVDRAIPCGLIVNELITNALRHAFVGRQEGMITVEMTREQKTCRIAVCDNGVGLPEGLVVHKASTLGLQLVVTLVEQIDAVLTVRAMEGTEFTVVFEAQ